MNIWFLTFGFLVASFALALSIWANKDRRYTSSLTVSSAYDAWTNDQLLERLWGEHVHLGYYVDSARKTDFRSAKIEFVHELVRWSGSLGPN